jgi:ring-1,2-phenylacetyl-CoA epoxidase subunit PaaD
VSASQVGGTSADLRYPSRDVRAALAAIPDPELPIVSIDELGILGAVTLGSDRVRVELHPTFVACPATELIRTTVLARLAERLPGTPADVVFVYDPPWSSDRISAIGRTRLAAAGIAAPLATGPDGLGIGDAVVACPRCGSTRTRLDNLFGPTQCRTIRWCPDCREPFEAIKTV